MNLSRLFCPLILLFLWGPASAAPNRKRIAIVSVALGPFSESVRTLSNAIEFTNPEKIPFEGTLVYDLDLPLKDGVIDKIFVLEPISPHEKLGVHREIYRPNGLSLYSGVDASPDGQHVLIKAGRMIDVGESLQYFVWHKNDRVPYQTSNIPKYARYILQAPQEAVFNIKTSWSPDGRYLGFYPGVIAGSNGLSPNIYSGFALYDVANDRTIKLNRLTVPISVQGWTPRGTLLGIGPYARLSKADPLYSADTENFIAAHHTSLYEFSVNEQKPKLIVQNAFGKAAMTADGQWVIFQGWADLEHPEQNKIQKNGTIIPSSKEPLTKGNPLLPLKNLHPKLHSVASTCLTLKQKNAIL